MGPHPGLESPNAITTDHRDIHGKPRPGHDSNIHFSCVWHCFEHKVWHARPSKEVEKGGLPMKLSSGRTRTIRPNPRPFAFSSNRSTQEQISSGRLENFCVRRCKTQQIMFQSCVSLDKAMPSCGSSVVAYALQIHSRGPIRTHFRTSFPILLVSLHGCDAFYSRTLPPLSRTM